MKYLATGVSLEGYAVRNVEIEAVSSLTIRETPEDYGFMKVAQLRPIRENDRRRNGRIGKRERGESSCG